MSLLPPCQSVLRLHSMRANTVSYIWKEALSNQIDLPLVEECGWNSEREITWIDEAFPGDVEDLFLEEDDAYKE